MLALQPPPKASVVPPRPLPPSVEELALPLPKFLPQPLRSDQDNWPRLARSYQISPGAKGFAWPIQIWSYWKISLRHHSPELLVLKPVHSQFEWLAGLGDQWVHMAKKKHSCLDESPFEVHLARVSSKAPMEWWKKSCDWFNKMWLKPTSCHGIHRHFSPPFVEYLFFSKHLKQI